MSRPEADDEALIGTIVAGKYRIDRLVGRGGMGAVYEATNTGIGKRVALKFLDREAARDADAVTRFQREAEAASAAESAHIVHIFDSGVTEDARPFLVMELLTGEDLRAALKREERIAVPDAVHIAGQVLRALSSAHAAGIVHRDLKPDNIFLCRRDDDPIFVKIVDFGISKVTRREVTADTLTRRGMVLGTAFYMSPEQAQAFRDVDGRTDLYSLGSILFEMLTGQPPHVGQVYEAVLIDICTKDAPDVRELVPEVSESIAAVLRRALMRDRDRRFQTAAEFYDALALAAPGLLRTGALGAVRSGRASHPDSGARSGSARSSSDGEPRIATAEGTAVRPASAGDTRAQARRTVVAAVVAALAAFALTVVLMANRQGRRTDDGVASAAPGPTVAAGGTAPSTQSGAGAGTTLDPARPDAGSAMASDAGTTGGKIRLPKNGVAKPAGSGPPTGKTADKPGPSGVATGLTLDTKGP